jgi:hypothetical protein
MEEDNDDIVLFTNPADAPEFWLERTLVDGTCVLEPLSHIVDPGFELNARPTSIGQFWRLVHHLELSDLRDQKDLVLHFFVAGSAPVFDVLPRGAIAKVSLGDECGIVSAQGESHGGDMDPFWPQACALVLHAAAAAREHGTSPTHLAAPSLPTAGLPVCNIAGVSSSTDMLKVWIKDSSGSATTGCAQCRWDNDAEYRVTFERALIDALTPPSMQSATSPALRIAMNSIQTLARRAHRRLGSGTASNVGPHSRQQSHTRQLSGAGHKRFASSVSFGSFSGEPAEDPNAVSSGSLGIVKSRRTRSDPYAMNLISGLPASGGSLAPHPPPDMTGSSVGSSSRPLLPPAPPRALGATPIDAHTSSSPRPHTQLLAATPSPTMPQLPPMAMSTTQPPAPAYGMHAAPFPGPAAHQPPPLQHQQHHYHIHHQMPQQYYTPTPAAPPYLPPYGAFYPPPPRPFNGGAAPHAHHSHSQMAAAPPSYSAFPRVSPAPQRQAPPPVAIYNASSGVVVQLQITPPAKPVQRNAPAAPVATAARPPSPPPPMPAPQGTASRCDDAEGDVGDGDAADGVRKKKTRRGKRAGVKVRERGTIARAAMALQIVHGAETFSPDAATGGLEGTLGVPSNQTRIFSARSAEPPADDGDNGSVVEGLCEQDDDVDDDDADTVQFGNSCQSSPALAGLLIDSATPVGPSSAAQGTSLAALSSLSSRQRSHGRSVSFGTATAFAQADADTTSLIGGIQSSRRTMSTGSTSLAPGAQLRHHARQLSERSLTEVMQSRAAGNWKAASYGETDEFFDLVFVNDAAAPAPMHVDRNSFFADV